VDEELEQKPGGAVPAGAASAAAPVVSTALAPLRQELEGLRPAGLDPHGLFLLGVVLARLERPGEARTALTESVTAWPWNWSAWKALSALIPDLATLQSLALGDHWMVQFFLADVYWELHASAESLAICDQLLTAFPGSAHVQAQMALAHYDERDFDRAQALFEGLRRADPQRLDHMDTYSNILFVKEAKGALAVLAHDAVQVDKYCPETCCIVGNYYSLKCDHEKAVVYFQRALRLNPAYLSAWTLMGHEFVELRNTSAAIRAYRKAVEINPRDYRAWYGLGQTYELLQMHTFALYYFGKATHVRPFDPRMWCAMGDAYDKLELVDDAIRCFKRAEANDDREGVAIIKLAKLYSAAGQPKNVLSLFSISSKSNRFFAGVLVL